MKYFLIIVFFAILIRGISQFVRLEKGVSIFFIFSLFAFIYYLGVPFELVFLNTLIVNTNMILPLNFIELIIVMGILCIVGFGVGYYLSGYRVKIDNNTCDNGPLRVRGVYFLVISVIIAISVLFFNELKSSFSSYSGNVVTTYSNPLYAYSKEVLFFSVSVMIVLLSIKRKLSKGFAILLTFGLIIFGVLSNDRDPILLAVIAWGVYFVRIFVKYRLNTVRTYLILFFMMILLIPVGSTFFSLYRGGGASTVDFIKKNGLYRIFDGVGPLESLNEALELRDEDRELGITYVSGFVNWIPKSIWADRPMDLSEKFARENIPNWKPGQGLGYSLLAEAYRNFGALGAFIQYFMIGLIIGGLGRLTRWIFKRKHPMYAETIFFIWLVYTLVIMHRGSFNIPSSYIRYILPFIFYYFIFDYYDWLGVLWMKKVKRLK